MISLRYAVCFSYRNQGQNIPSTKLHSYFSFVLHFLNGLRFFFFNYTPFYNILRWACAPKKTMSIFKRFKKIFLFSFIDSLLNNLFASILLFLFWTKLLDHFIQKIPSPLFVVLLSNLLWDDLFIIVFFVLYYDYKLLYWHLNSNFLGVTILLVIVMITKMLNFWLIWI